MKQAKVSDPFHEQELLAVPHQDKRPAQLGHVDSGAGDILKPAGHTAMINVVVGDEDPLDVTDVFADFFQRFFKADKCLGSVESGVEQCDPAVINGNKGMDMHQPKRHRQGEHIKIVRNFFQHDHHCSISGTAQ